MYIKINLSSDLFNELSNKIAIVYSPVRENISRHLNKGKTQFAYDTYCPVNGMYFTVLLSFLSHGVAFAYCSCGLPANKRCNHIEDALLFHQERSRSELEKFFGADVIVEEAVF